jgi:hypothetical protein
MFKILSSVDDDKSSAKTIISNSKLSMIYILPNDEITGSITNNYVKAIVKKENTTIATVYAPINMTLNTFGLASVNA